MTQVKAVKIEILSAEAEIKYCKSLPKVFEVTKDAAEPDIMWWRANREIKENICNQRRESKVDLRVTMADGARANNRTGGHTGENNPPRCRLCALSYDCDRPAN